MKKNIDKKALYEKIMSAIVPEVKKAIDEDWRQWLKNNPSGFDHHDPEQTREDDFDTLYTDLMDVINGRIIDFVKANYDMENVYICSAVANNIVWDEKNKWLDKYFPEIPVKNRLFVGNKDWKWVFVKQFAEHQGWKQNEVTLVDDLHSTIKKCRANGINCIHPSNIEAITDPYAILG